MSKKNLKLRPLSDRIVIEPQEPKGKTASGIFLPQTAKDKSQKGTVLAVGPGGIDDDGKRTKMDVKMGDVVLYFSNGGTKIKIDDRKLLILKESEIIAIVET